MTGARVMKGMTATPHRYTSPEEDSGRWLGFPFRDGDIVNSARSKSGTTWMQTICALLVFGSPKIPETLTDASPWLDHLIRPREDVYARLANQSHRRFIKTHTPLDGLPLDPRATYVVVARHPLDMAVSLYYQGDNIDRARVAELTATASSDAPGSQRPPVHDWLVAWIDSGADPRESMDSLPGVMWHLADAWSRRKEPNVMLVRYRDLETDLDGEMHRLADGLGFAIREDVWADLVDAATFAQMGARSEQLAPNPGGILKDPDAFFRRGRSGAGTELLTDNELRVYEARSAELAPSELLAWLHSR